MRHLLFIALCDIHDLANGVTLKVKTQIDAFEQLGFKVTKAVYDDDYVMIEDENQLIKVKSTFRRRALFQQAITYIKSHHVDVAFIRLPHFDMYFMHLLRILKKHNIKVYMEVPSFPIHYPKHSLSNKYYAWFDYMNRHKIKRYVNMFLSVGEPTNEIFGVKNVSIPNGYMSKTDNYAPLVCLKDEIHIISVSSFYDTHGFDRLIQGLDHYLHDEKHQTKVHIHLVGDGPTKANLKKEVEQMGLEDYITFYPSMKGKELDDLYAKMNMGCGPLGVHRMHSLYASPLKTKDYFQKGLPFFCGYQEIGVEEDYPYVLKLPSDDSPIDINRIVEFYLSYQHDCDHVQKQMRSYGDERFNWYHIMKRMIE